MRHNVGNVDRVVRVVVAVAAVALAIAVGPSSVIGIVAFVVAGVMALTAALGTCPLYSLFGVSTCPVRATER